MRTQLLSLFAVVCCLAGCQSNPMKPPPNSPVGPVGVGDFMEQWNAPLLVGLNQPITRLFLRNDVLFAYTAENRVYAMSASGGQLMWVRQIGHPGDQIQPPLLMEKNLTVIPTISTIERVEANGNGLPPIEIGHSVRSPLAGAGNFVYCGLDYPTGGRVAKIDLTKPYNNTVWEFVIQGGISAAPVLTQAIVFIGGEDGNVYAVNEAREVVWPLEDGIFKTDGRIVADLKADNSGLYIASTDTKLYCLDITTGRIKWQYFASLPLVDSPVITAESVYQALPGQGVAALDKSTGEFNRKPRWIVSTAKTFLAEDAQFAYLQGIDNSIIGVDKKTGEVRLHSQRTDLVAFASNPKGDFIYAATANGQVLGIKAVTKPGVVGTVVSSEMEFERVAVGK